MSSWRCWVSHSRMSWLTKVACVGKLKSDSSLFLSGIQQTLIVHFVIARLCSVCTAGQVQKLRNTPGVCCFCLMLLTWAICLWNTALQVISIKVNNSLCTMAATYSIIAANACGFAIHPWQWQMFESFSHCHTVTGVDEYILINKSSSC